MPKSRIALSLCALAVAAVLTACSQPQSPAMTADDVKTDLDSVQSGAMTVLGDASLADLSGLLDGIDASPFLATGPELPRGVYEYDPVAVAWDLIEPSDDLELRWEVQGTGEAAVLVVDWDASASTVVRTLPGDEEVELPQGASVVLSLEAVVVAAFDQTAAWPVSECGYLTEPGSFHVSGSVESSGTTLTLDETGVSIAGTGADVDVESQGGLELASAAGSAWLDWTLGLALTATRDDATCAIVDAEVKSGHVSVDLGVQTPTEDASVGFATNFAIHLPETPDDVTTLSLSGGRLTLNGTLAVTWTGVLDDSNSNGVPGENLLLTFADGTMTLEEFLTEHYAPLAVAARVARALR